MCTYQTQMVDVTGSGWNAAEWFGLGRAVVSFDHPEDAALEHALVIDLRGRSGDPNERVAVELDAASARRLADAILVSLEPFEVSPR